MKNKLTPFQKELLNKIKEILYTEWNPLGGDDVQRDEYDSYALQVFGMIQKSESLNIISNYLNKIETEYMGLVGDRKNCEKSAKRIINLFNKTNNNK